MISCEIRLPLTMVKDICWVGGGVGFFLVLTLLPRLSLLEVIVKVIQHGLVDLFPPLERIPNLFLCLPLCLPAQRSLFAVAHGKFFDDAGQNDGVKMKVMSHLLIDSTEALTDPSTPLHGKRHTGRGEGPRGVRNPAEFST